MQHALPSTQQALLVIADISGFTQFMKSQEHAAGDAMQIVVELLKSVVAVGQPPLRLVEVEGDALFFYALVSEPRTLGSIKRNVSCFFQAFEQKLRQLCATHPCAAAARNLRLKVILHAGAVARERIHGFDKLFGMDVILAHRLLKNSVAAHEYILLTRAAYDLLGAFNHTQPQWQMEYYEDIGAIEVAVFFSPLQNHAFADVARKYDPTAHCNRFRFSCFVEPDNAARDYVMHSQVALHVAGHERMELRSGPSP